MEVILGYTNLAAAIDRLAVSGGAESEFDRSLFTSELRRELTLRGLSGSGVAKAVIASFRRSSALYRGNRNLRGWVEKTPTHAAHFETMLADFPKASFVHIVRDPRDNWISYQRKQPAHRLESFVYNWRRLARQAILRKRACGRD